MNLRVTDAAKLERLPDQNVDAVIWEEKAFAASQPKQVTGEVELAADRLTQSLVRDYLSVNERASR
jgi:hypothetical protein